jgi:hypothetical protein
MAGTDLCFGVLAALSLCLRLCCAERRFTNVLFTVISLKCGMNTRPALYSIDFIRFSDASEGSSQGEVTHSKGGLSNLR